jgi:O-antigen biosynthesis protein
MNILFVMYGDFGTNSAHPMAMHARHLRALGHECVAAVPGNLGSIEHVHEPAFRPVLYDDALAAPESLFSDGRAADILHAWTPREGVRKLVTRYLAERPTAWVIYLEDNESWIARTALAATGLTADVLLQHSEDVISTWTPDGLAHVLRYEAFVGLADGAVVIQDKLASEVPPWVPCDTVMPGVDLRFFAPRERDAALKERYGVRPGERVVVYPGGLNDFTRPGIEALCLAVGLLNRGGTPCRLLRSGPVALDFLERLPPEAAQAVVDLGPLPRAELPALLALADVLVQPGKPEPFEDLRLPGKLPELFASGRPVVLPDTNIAHLLRDGVEALVHRSGAPEEIAAKCLALFADPARAASIGAAGRRFAEAHFDPATQAARLEAAYRRALERFDAAAAREIWRGAPASPTASVLARRLRMLASSPLAAKVDAASLLATHARLVESTRERAASLELGFDARDREIAVRDERLARLEAALADSQQALGQARQVADQRTGDLRAMESSLSWRMTAPLRRLLGLFSRDAAASSGAAVDLELRPLERDPVLERRDDGTACWRAHSSDPAFLASTPAGAARIAVGWYRARAEIHQRAGRVAGPRVYVPDARGSYSEFRSVELRSQGDVYTAEVFVAAPTPHVRFDPSIYPCEFSCERLELAPLGSGRRWLGTAVGIAKVVARLSPRQLAVWFRQGMGVLLTRGPRALWDAAYWAVANHARAQDVAYPEWVREYATPLPAELAAMAKAAAAFARRPRVSFITPVYNTPAPFLRAMIESVLAQAYDNWQLCLADDASSAPHVRPILEEYAARDSRIAVAWRGKNGHISAASNSALQLAAGDYVALLDHDDALPPDALYWVVKEINDHPDAALLYSDEDKLDFDGVRTLPYFKCDWNYDLFLAHNLVTHLGVYRADIVRDIGGFREGFEGAQDYDLALRFIERIEPAQIRHIPRVLYHWRMLAGSTSVGAGEKSYAAERARVAVNEHLARTQVDAVADTIPELAVQRVRYRLPEPPALASIIIPTRNALKLVRQCVESIRAKTTYSAYEIILVDNGSDDAAALRYFDELAASGTIRLLRDARPFNFSRLNNEAAREARGAYLVFLNNDIEVITPDWLGELVSHAQRPGIGAVGAKLWYPDDTIQHAGLVLVAGLAAHAHYKRKRGDHGYFSRASLTQSLSAVTAACMCVRREVFEAVGGFDETLAVAFNDVDLCLRIQAAGFRNLYTPYAELYHHESATRGYEDTPEKMQRFHNEADILRARWMPVLMNDPYYNPNLTLSGDPFTLAWPPRVERFHAT